MLDARMRKVIDPVLNQIGRGLADTGIDANAVTLIGLGFGVLAAVMIAMGLFALALIPLALSRIADGLDGAIARASRKTDFG